MCFTLSVGACFGHRLPGAQRQRESARLAELWLNYGRHLYYSSICWRATYETALKRTQLSSTRLIWALFGSGCARSGYGYGIVLLGQSAPLSAVAFWRQFELPSARLPSVGPSFTCG